MHPAPVFGGSSGSGMDKSMVGALMWNMLAWLLWGVLILMFRYHVERQHQKAASAEALASLEETPTNA
jgi:heme exporter protein C